MMFHLPELRWNQLNDVEWKPQLFRYILKYNKTNISCQLKNFAATKTDQMISRIIGAEAQSLGDSLFKSF
jgi:hypothetical protein